MRWWLLGLAGCHGVSCLAAGIHPWQDSSANKNNDNKNRYCIRSVISTRANGGAQQGFFFGSHPDSTDASTDASTSTANDENAKNAKNGKKHGNPSHNNKKKKKQRIFRLASLENTIKSTFLPSGYPSRTPPGYLRFAVWSWTQDLSTQLRSVLATQRILEGVGVGREGSTALSAILNFLVRDGCGMAATLLFTALKASAFRYDVKRWRLFADIMVDIGITLEVAAPQVPSSLFLPMICLGNVGKAICGVAASACGGAINLHWAKGSDISDINAKFGAQHTVTGSLGLVFAWIFTKSVSQVDHVHLWACYTALTALHIFANARCMRLIAFDHFNTQRFNMVLDDFLDQSPISGVVDRPLLSPAQVARQEPLFFRPLSTTTKPTHIKHHPSTTPIRFGVSFNEFIEETGMTLEQAEQMLVSGREPYTMAVRVQGHTHRVYVCLKSHISSKNKIKAYLHACLLARRLEHGNLRMARREVDHELPTLWSSFVRKCQECGWDLSKEDIQTQGYEIAVQR